MRTCNMECRPFCCHLVRFVRQLSADITDFALAFHTRCILSTLGHSGGCRCFLLRSGDFFCSGLCSCCLQGVFSAAHPGCFCSVQRHFLLHRHGFMALHKVSAPHPLLFGCCPLFCCGQQEFLALPPRQSQQASKQASKRASERASQPATQPASKPASHRASQRASEPASKQASKQEQAQASKASQASKQKQARASKAR